MSWEGWQLVPHQQQFGDPNQSLSSSLDEPVGAGDGSNLHNQQRKQQPFQQHTPDMSGCHVYGAVHTAGTPTPAECVPRQQKHGYSAARVEKPASSIIQKISHLVASQRQALAHQQQHLGANQSHSSAYGDHGDYHLQQQETVQHPNMNAMPHMRHSAHMPLFNTPTVYSATAPYIRQPAQLPPIRDTTFDTTVPPRMHQMMPPVSDTTSNAVANAYMAQMSMSQLYPHYYNAADFSRQIYYASYAMPGFATHPSMFGYGGGGGWPTGNNSILSMSNSIPSSSAAVDLSTNGYATGSQQQIFGQQPTQLPPTSVDASSPAKSGLCGVCQRQTNEHLHLRQVFKNVGKACMNCTNDANRLSGAVKEQKLRNTCGGKCNTERVREMLKAGMDRKKIPRCCRWMYFLELGFDETKIGLHLWVTVLGFTMELRNQVEELLREYGKIADIRPNPKAKNCLDIRYSSAKGKASAFAGNGRVLHECMIGVINCDGLTDVDDVDTEMDEEDRSAEEEQENDDEEEGENSEQQQSSSSSAEMGWNRQSSSSIARKGYYKAAACISEVKEQWARQKKEMEKSAAERKIKIAQLTSERSMISSLLEIKKKKSAKDKFDVAELAWEIEKIRLPTEKIEIEKAKIADENKPMKGIQDDILHYEEAIKIEPTNAEAHNNLASIFQAQGRSHEAILHYEEAIKIEPTNAEAHKNLALILEKQDRSHEAILHYEEAIKIEPTNAEAHINLAIILQEEGKIEQARELFLKALEIDPNLESAQKNLANF